MKIKASAALFLACAAIAACGSDENTRTYTTPSGKKMTYKVDQTPEKDQSAEALTLCQSNIKRVSYDPDNTNIPFVRGRRTSQDYVFSWNRDSKMIRSRNRLGSDVPVVVTCIVEAQSLEMKLLTWDGKTVFP